MAVQTGSCLAWQRTRRLVVVVLFFFLMGLIYDHHVLYLLTLSNLLVELYHVLVERE